MESAVQDAAVPRRRRDEETVQLGFRLPVELVSAIDAEEPFIAPPGLRISRTDAIRVLLTEALAARKAARDAQQKKK